MKMIMKIEMKGDITMKIKIIIKMKVELNGDGDKGRKFEKNEHNNEVLKRTEISIKGNNREKAVVK